MKSALKQADPQRKMLLEGAIALLEGDEVTLYRESDEPFSIVPMAMMAGPSSALATFIRDGKFQIEID